MPPRVIGDHAAAIRTVAAALHTDCDECRAGVEILRLVADEMSADKTRAGALGGKAGTGRAKRRGGSEYYRRLGKKSARARKAKAAE